MLYSRRLIVLAIPMIASCATAGKDQPSEGVDGSVENPIDAPPTTIDAPGHPPIDAPAGCTPMIVELLANPGFDATPIGTGWVSTPINATYPVITAQDGIPEQSPANKAWMGGLAQANANDSLYQDIAVPASTTALVLTGFYEVRSAETGSTVYDRGTVDLVQTTGTPIESILALDNAHKTTTWTAINHPITAAVAGQTVRLRLTSASDDTLVSSFYFDSLSLMATTCQ